MPPLQPSPAKASKTPSARAPPGQRNKPGGRCPGDLTFNPGGGSSDRGYIDVGQGNGNSGLYDAIVNNSFYSTAPLTIGSIIDTVNGNMHVGPGIGMRFNQDIDTTTAAYNRNGCRLMISPVNNAQNPPVVVGFARLLLEANSCTDNNKPGAGGAGLYRVKLFH